MLEAILKNQSRHIFRKISLVGKFLALLFIFLFNSFAVATNVPEFVNFRQPNGYTFVARGEGDEFLHRFKTLDDFTIICGTNDWWYYAYQGTDGKLYPTQYRVGIEYKDASQSLTENVNYSQSIIDAANLQRSTFNVRLTVQPIGPISIGVILIDFPDRIATRINPNDPNNLVDPAINNPNNSNWAKRYCMNDFVKLFFSTNTYITTSPDGYPVYGSLNDYWKEVSYNQVNLSGAILNQQDANGKPTWYRADNNSTTYTRPLLVEEAKNKAIAAGFNVNGYSKICIIFAGQWGGNLWPSANVISWWMGERNSGWDLDYGFASIGVHAHEFGHTLGLGDLYDQSYVTCGVGGYSLMGYGNYGADIQRPSRPVHLLAYEKIRLGYFNPEPITGNVTNKTLQNIEQNATALKIILTNSGQIDEYFLIENRQPIGFDAAISTGDILITHYFSDNPNSYTLDIEEVGGIATNGCGIQSNLYPLDFYYRPLECGNYNNARVESADFMNLQNQVFSPWSTPNSNRNAYGGTFSDVAVVYKNQNGSSSIIDVYKTNAINAPPSKPQNLKLTVLYNHPVLTWDANQETDLAGYNIYRAENGGEPQLIGYVNQAGRKTFTDYTANTSIPSDNYDYTIKAKDNSALLSINSGKVSVMALVPKIYLDNGEVVPSEYILEQNYPNPFNPSAIINYTLKDAGLVKIKVYNILGSEVAELVNEMKEAGYHSLEFNASNLPSGVYIYTLQVNGFSSSNKMLLLK